MSILLGLSALPVLAASTETAAKPNEAEKSPWQKYIGGRVGFLEVEHVDAGSFNLGLMFGYSFSSVFAIEGSLDYHTPEYDLLERATYALGVSLNVYPFASHTRIRPYAVGGIGYYLSRFEFDSTLSNMEDESVGEGGYHAGFGIEFPMDKGLPPDEALRLVFDVRYLFTEEDESLKIEADGVLATVGVKVPY